MIEVKNLNKTYDPRRGEDRRVLKDVSFALPDTGFVCILGPSGCGKTSLLNAVGGLDRFESGQITAGEVTARSYGTPTYEAERNRSLGYIFQNYYLLQNHSVAYNVYLGLHSLDLSHREKIQRVKEALAAVDMERYLRRRTSELSGGQQQRVAIARALARRPRVIFADEPTGNLDESNTLNICKLLHKISRNSLVVMVTHEERIANFFADRIIRLDGGVVFDDSSSWDRESLSLSGSNAIYTGDYRQEHLENEGITLRLLQQEGAAPVNLTVIAGKDRIVIKLDDSRTITCGTGKESPVLVEGNRPQMTRNMMERGDAPEEPQEHTRLVRAGQGLGLKMMFSEVRELMRGRGKTWFATWFFLTLLTVLTVWMVGDYLTLRSVDPREFVVTDSHILEMSLERGENHEFSTTTFTQETMLRGTVAEYLEDLSREKTGYTLLPNVVSRPEVETQTYFPQMENIAIKLDGFSYVPLEYLPENSLILGRMPENVHEVVVDRWVLDAALMEDGILQSSITDISFFLNKNLNFPKLGYSATIVGISDNSEAALYATPSVISTLGVNGRGFMTLSELRQLYPGQFDDITLADDECLLVKNSAENQNKPGQSMNFNIQISYTIQAQIEVETYAKIIVADSQVEAIIASQASIARHFLLYCPDKAAMRESITADPLEKVRGQQLQMELKDRYQDSWDAYESASRLKADARTVVLGTVIVLSAVMLYLLRRAQVHSRIELLAVYRLLGIPKHKLGAIFAMESGVTVLESAVPAAMLTWCVVRVLTGIEDLGVSMVLSWQTALTMALVIWVYHLAVSMVPLYRLLRLPPAKLASRYDF